MKTEDVILTTEDGVEVINPKQLIFGIDKKLETCGIIIYAEFVSKHPDIKFFSTTELRAQYIELHTPKYSIAEYRKMENLAKSLYKLINVSDVNMPKGIPKEWFIQS